VLVKGKHGLKFIVEKSTNNSIDMNPYLNDGIIDGSDNRVMMNKVEKKISSKPIYPKMITRKSFYEKRKVVGKLDDSFRKVYSMFKKDMFENFTLVDIDLESLSFTCFINYTDLWNINQIYQFYLDGTFKSKFFRGSHYNLLVFATCLPKSLRTIPVAFTVSFKNTGNVYNELWKKIIRVLIKHKIKANFCSLISDMGSGELKFIKNASKIFRHVFCWFHVLNKNFIPILDKCKYGVDVIEKIIYLVRYIYSAKKYTQRGQAVTKLRNFLVKYECTRFSKHLEDNGYLTHKLDKWTSLYKLSQYSDHSINYLERMFGKITNKKSEKQIQLPLFVTKLNEVVGEVIKLHEDLGEIQDKRYRANKTFKKGKYVYEHSEFVRVSSTKYKVKAVLRSKGWFNVCLRDVHCECGDFNYNGYPCKHVFGSMIRYLVEELGFDYRDKIYSKSDGFNMLRRTRSYIVRDETLRFIIKTNESPVTIGEYAFMAIKDLNISL
jgi:uncharacterized protein YneF (UPF0154 family)